MVINLEVGQQQAGAFVRRPIETERLLESQNSAVKLPGRRHIIGIEPNVGDANNLWADDRATGGWGLNLGKRAIGQQGCPNE